MKCACISDMHGHLPIMKHIECDLVLVGGDILPARDHGFHFQRNWLDVKFRRWLEMIKVPVIGVSGNHDFIFQEAPDDVPDLPWIYLQDSGTTLENGLKVWGSPWQVYYGGWAFNLEESDLREKWSLIPHDTDILLLHSPPHGVGDVSLYDQVHTGSTSLTNRIESIEPKLVVFGHNHSGYGTYYYRDTVLVNASHCNEESYPNNPVQVVEIK